MGSRLHAETPGRQWSESRSTRTRSAGGERQEAMGVSIVAGVGVPSPAFLLSVGLHGVGGCWTGLVVVGGSCAQSLDSNLVSSRHT